MNDDKGIILDADGIVAEKAKAAQAALAEAEAAYQASLPPKKNRDLRGTRKPPPRKAKRLAVKAARRKNRV